MKKGIIVSLIVGLIASAVAVAPAQAGKKKPIEHTLYMHGPSQFGELDGVEWFNQGAGPKSLLTMTPEEPAAGPPKSMTYQNPALNDECTGLPLAFPTFTTDFAGTIVGDAKLTLNLVGTPGTIKARIWADMGAFVGCNEGYVPPASEVDVPVAPGQSTVEVTFPKLKLKGTYMLMVEVLALSGEAAPAGGVGRLLYDSTDAATSLTFNCIPASGKSCV